MIQEHIVAALEDPSRIHYKNLWLVSSVNEERELLELFSFGQIKDAVGSIRKQMTPRMWTKLQKLTLLKLCCEKRTINYSQIIDECALASRLEVEQLAMGLGDVVDLQIDETESQIYVQWCQDCRDVYNGEHQLMVVSEPANTRLAILEDLRKWRSKLTNDMS